LTFNDSLRLYKLWHVSSNYTAKFSSSMSNFFQNQFTDKSENNCEIETIFSQINRDASSLCFVSFVCWSHYWGKHTVEVSVLEKLLSILSTTMRIHSLYIQYVSARCLYALYLTAQFKYKSSVETSTKPVKLQKKIIETRFPMEDLSLDRFCISVTFDRVNWCAPCVWVSCSWAMLMDISREGVNIYSFNLFY
jgi:hypothetical protein